MKSAFRFAAFTLAILLVPTWASARSFSDVPESHAAYEAVEYLRTNGYIQGYPDGTFRPDQKVNRAEAIKLIVAPLAPADQLSILKTSEYADVAADVWFLPFVEWARQKLGIIDGPPKAATFNGGRPVTKAEFLKMFLLSQKVDAAGAYAEIRLPLSSDVTDPDQWYYPFLRYAISTSMTLVSQQGTLNPAQELNRGQIALMMHRYFMYTENRRTQALLSEAESEIVNVLQMLEGNDIAQAEYASARALVAARGAHQSRPDEPLVKGALKTAEAFRLLVRAYRAGVNGKLQEVVDLAKQAWDTGEKIRGFSGSLDALATQVQSLAKSMADEARALLGQ